MYDATLKPVSNRADWIGTFEMVDDDTDQVITDLSDISLTIEVRKRGDCRPVLVATNENGRIIDAGNGILQWRFTRTEMTAICPGSYEIGVTISRDDETDQKLIGTVPIIDGIVSR